MLVNEWVWLRLRVVSQQFAGELHTEGGKQVWARGYLPPALIIPSNVHPYTHADMHTLHTVVFTTHTLPQTLFTPLKHVMHVHTHTRRIMSPCYKVGLDSPTVEDTF